MDDDIVVTVVKDYDRESIAVFVNGDFAFGGDCELDPYQLLLALSRYKGLLDNIEIEERFTYGRPHEYFEDTENQ